MLADLVTLAEKQHRAIRIGDLVVAKALIRKKEDLAREIMAIRDKKDSLSAGAAWRTDEAKQLLECYLALESESVALLSNECDAVRRKRKKVGSGRKALRGYRPQGGGGPRFCDKQA